MWFILLKILNMDILMSIVKRYFKIFILLNSMKIYQVENVKTVSCRSNNIHE
jgi:hypothetical protein